MVLMKLTVSHWNFRVLLRTDNSLLKQKKKKKYKNRKNRKNSVIHAAHVIILL